jgi:DedD protein
MALFKFRKTGDDAPTGPSQPESVEVLRRRARHRLIGAAVLVLVGVVGFPLLFDTQPRPVPVDIPIEIPDRNKVKPLVVQPAAPAPPAVEAAPPAQASAPAASSPAAKIPANEALGPREEVVVPPKPEAKPEAKSEQKAAAKADDGDRAKALLEGKQPAAAADAAGTRFIVQVGAFADMAKAREAQRKLEKAGLKNYIQSVDTKEGKRNRVRAGPFGSRAEADQAVEKIKALDLPAAILTL